MSRARMKSADARLALGLFLLSCPVAAAERLALPAGPHPVGFTVVERRDSARRMPDGTPRPLQVSVWYPAAAGGADTLRYRDYVLVAAREKTLAPLDASQEAAALERYRAFLTGNGVSAAAVEAWLGASMTAVRDASPAGGRFPVVLIATGTGGAVQDEAALGEFLASHGYLVATTPSPVRLGSPLTSDADVLPRAQEQAEDLAQALAVLRARADADGARTGLLGYSFGARAALLLAARRRDVRALVSLEGGIASAQPGDWLPPAFPRASVRTPILHVYGDGDPASPPAFTLLESLTGARKRMVKVAGLRHLDFITYGLAAAILPEMADGGSAARLEGIRAAGQHARAFFDAHLKGIRSR